MTIQEWGAIGEVAGALAVFVTLAYLAAQVRYARISTTDLNRQSRVEGVREINGRLVTNPDLRRVYDAASSPAWREMVQSLASTWAMHPDDASLLLWGQIDYVWTHWAQFRSKRTPDDTRELLNIVSAWYSAAPMKDIFAQPTFREHFDEDFVKWVDSVVATGT